MQSNIAKMRSELNSFKDSYDIDESKIKNIESMIDGYANTMD